MEGSKEFIEIQGARLGKIIRLQVKRGNVICEFKNEYNMLIVL